MQNYTLEKKEDIEKTFNNPNNVPSSNPNSEIEAPQTQNGINNFFPLIFSLKVILDSLHCQQKTIYLQKELRGANISIIEYIVNELCGFYREVISDKNGNYFISDLIKVCEQ